MEKLIENEFENFLEYKTIQKGGVDIGFSFCMDSNYAINPNFVFFKNRNKNDKS